MQHADSNVAEIKILIICNGSEVEGDVCRFMQAILGAGQLSQPPSSGQVISLNMSIEHILDFHSFRFREFDVCVDVLCLRVHDRGPCFPGSTKEVSGAARFVIKVLSKDHLLSVNTSGLANENTKERMIREMNCSNHYDRGPLSFWEGAIGLRVGSLVRQRESLKSACRSLIHPAIEVS